jgi:hypothetical protein
LNVAEEWSAGLHEAGYGGGMVATVVAVTMVGGGGRSGRARDAAMELKMIDESGIGARKMRDGFCSGKNVALGIAMAVGQNYEVSKQTALSAWRVRK